MNDLSYTLPLLPENKREAVTKALNAAFGTDAIENADLLTGGLSSALVYRIAIDGKPYVLRVILKVDALTDPSRQFQCLRSAAEAGIAPRVYYTDTDDALSLTDFVDVSAVTQPLPRQERRQRLAELIRQIHALPPFPPLVNHVDAVDGFVQRYQASPVLPEAATADIFAGYADVQRHYPRHDPDRVSSHNDLNPNNVLFDGNRLWVVDWDAAFLNDRYVDPANAATLWSMTADEEDAYLRAYFGDALSDYHRARFFLMRLVCRMLNAMNFLAMAAATSPPGTVLTSDAEVPSLQEFNQRLATDQRILGTAEGQSLYAQVLLREMRHDMQSARFAEAIRRMQSFPVPER